MSLRLIVGRAGTGKTRLCLQEIAQKNALDPWGPALIMLTPEQATFQYERLLLQENGIQGMMRIQVLSFRRLAWRILQETGGIGRKHIGDLGKKMILRNILEHKRDLLQVFGRSAWQKGFVQTLAATIGEMKLYQVKAENLLYQENLLAKRGQPLLAGKLADLAFISQELEKALADQYTDPDDYLGLLAEKSAGSDLLRKAEFWVDGFKGFTPQEYGVLEALLGIAARVNVVLCLDAAYLDAGEGDVFYPTVETYHTLMKLALQKGIALDHTVRFSEPLPHRYEKAPSLAHLERSYFAQPRGIFANQPQEIKLVAATSPRAEVEAAAREIIALGRDRGWRWRDMAVLVRDLAPYECLFASVFSAAGIPFFIDHKRSVMHHPLIELIRSALETVGGNWAYEPVFRYCKTDLLSVSRDEVDILENYVLSAGIKGNMWLKEENWRVYATLRHSNDQEKEQWEQRINDIRKAVSKELLVFHYQVKSATCTVKAITQSLYELLLSLEVPQKLEQWTIEAQANHCLEESMEHGQIWSIVTGLLEELVAALGNEVLPLKEYAAVLEAGLESLRLGFIPPALDQLIVGVLDRSRSPEVKATLLLGVGDGVLPARFGEEGIFSDQERDRLSSNGLILAPTSRRRVLEEQYLIYQALTRSSAWLYISYPLADQEGKALLPSPIVGRIKDMFPSLKEHLVRDEPEDGNGMEYVATPKGCLGYLGVKLKEAITETYLEPVWQEVYHWLLPRQEYQEKLQSILTALFYTNAIPALSSKTANALYGKKLYTSVTRLEQFSQCPFSHFLAYDMQLKERKLYKLSAPDMGQFFHEGLKLYVETLQHSTKDWASLQPEDITDLVKQVVNRLTPQLQHEILLSSARNRGLLQRLTRQLTRAAMIWGEHFRRGCFRPSGLEVGFGLGETLPPLLVPLPGGKWMGLCGRIDRLDVAQDEQTSYLRVLDYKSGAQKFALTQVYYGLDLQLPVYLAVALDYAPKLFGTNALPGGMFYFTVADPLLNFDGPEEPEEIKRRILRELKLKGVALANPEVIKMMDAHITGHSELLPVGLGKNGFYAYSQVLTEEGFGLLMAFLQALLGKIGASMMTGEVAIAPYRLGQFSPCVYCIYHPVCQFDPLWKGNQYRSLSPLDGQEVWEKMMRFLREKKDGI